MTRVPANNFPKPIAWAMSAREIYRFLRLVSCAGGLDGACWLWTGYRDKKGYGQFKWRGRSWWAHRVSYRTFVGQIPEGMTINHKPACRNPSCVNPDHLELMTLVENSRRQHGPATDPKDDDFIPD